MCPRIAEHIALAFGISINKDVVRRILDAHYHLSSNGSSPSWLPSSVTRRTAFTASMCSHVNPRHYAHTGAGRHGPLHSAHCRIRNSRRNCGWQALCRMFNRAMRWQTVPKYLSSDHDPLHRFHQWQANLRVLAVTKSKRFPMFPYRIRSLGD